MDEVICTLDVFVVAISNGYIANKAKSVFVLIYLFYCKFRMSVVAVVVVCVVMNFQLFELNLPRSQTLANCTNILF